MGQQAGQLPNPLILEEAAEQQKTPWRLARGVFLVGEAETIGGRAEGRSLIFVVGVTFTSSLN